jgi:hypothetical protein
MHESGTVSRAPRRAFTPSPGVVGRDMGGAAVLIHLDSNRIFELNPTGARIWAHLKDGCDTQQIAERLRTEFHGVPAETLAGTVDELLASLEREGLIRGL